jgi:hypothetical protein
VEECSVWKGAPRGRGLQQDWGDLSRNSVYFDILQK